jgi:hypothetical protein
VTGGAVGAAEAEALGDALAEGAAENVVIGAAALTEDSSAGPRRAKPTSARSASTKAIRPAMIHGVRARERVAILQD